METEHEVNGWRKRARCIDADPDDFFPELGTPSPVIAAVKQICMECPVREQCLEEAIRDTKDIYSIRGGLSGRQRRSVRVALGIEVEEEWDWEGEAA
jgi:WhiB family transcriptional regulator, redox-sensing transcriptional regulator